MRRLILFLVVACAIAVPAASAAPAKNSVKNDSGVLCVLHANLSAEGGTGSTSTDTGKTKIKVLADGTIEFKTKIKNEDGETFVAAHIHEGAVGVEGSPLTTAPGAPLRAGKERLEWRLRPLSSVGRAPPW